MNDVITQFQLDRKVSPMQFDPLFCKFPNFAKADELDKVKKLLEHTVKQTKIYEPISDVEQFQKFDAPRNQLVFGAKVDARLTEEGINKLLGYSHFIKADISPEELNEAICFVACHPNVFKDWKESKQAKADYEHSDAYYEQLEREQQ